MKSHAPGNSPPKMGACWGMLEPSQRRIMSTSLELLCHFCLLLKQILLIMVFRNTTEEWYQKCHSHFADMTTVLLLRKIMFRARVHKRLCRYPDLMYLFLMLSKSAF